MESVGDVKLTSRLLAEHEDTILDRTHSVCYIGGSSQVLQQPVVEGEVNTSECGESENVAGDGKTKREARLQDQMTLQAAKKAMLIKKVRKLKMKNRDKGKEVIRITEHVKVVEALKKELDDERAEKEESLKQAHDQKLKLERVMADKLKQAHKKLKLEKETVRKLKYENEVKNLLLEMGYKQEREWFNKALEHVTAERKWLIEEGFEYVIKRLHKSDEYNIPLGAVQTKLWNSGAHYGVVAGYASCKDGVALEDVDSYKPEAYEEFLKAVHELEHTQFPYVVALSQCVERTLDELKALEPKGLEADEDDGVGGGQ